MIKNDKIIPNSIRNVWFKSLKKQVISTFLWKWFDLIKKKHKNVVL